MNPITTVSHSPLTQNDIARMPAHATNITAQSASVTADSFVPTEPKKSSILKKTIIAIVGIGILAVGAKHFCKDLLKVDNANPKWTDCIKKGITTVADCVEWPFRTIKNLFTKTEEAAANAAADGAAKAGTEAANAAAEGAAKAGTEAANAAAEGATKAGTEAANAAAEGAAKAGTEAANAAAEGAAKAGTEAANAAAEGAAKAGTAS